MIAVEDSSIAVVRHTWMQIVVAESTVRQAAARQPVVPDRNTICRRHLHNYRVVCGSSGRKIRNVLASECRTQHRNDAVTFSDSDNCAEVGAKLINWHASHVI